MKWPLFWALVMTGIWTASSGCSHRQEPQDETRPQDETTPSTTSVEGSPVAVDTTDSGPRTFEDAAGTWAEVNGIPALGYVSAFVGKTPLEVGLWGTNPLAPFLYQTLGPRYQTFLINMQEAEPIQEEDGVVYILGHKKYSEDRAAVAIDTATDGIYVWLLVAGKPEEYQWGDAAITLPAAVRKLVDQSSPTP